MCYNCDEWYMKDEYNYMVPPTCLDAGPLEVVLTFNAQKWMTVVEVKTPNPLENLAYAFSNEVLAKMGPADVIDVLLYNFTPLIKKYPKLADQLIQLVNKEYKPKPIISSPPGFLNKQELYEALKKQATQPIYNVNKYTNDYAKYQNDWDEFEKYDADAAKKYFGEPSKYVPVDPKVGGRRPEVDKLPGLQAKVKYPGTKNNVKDEWGNPMLTMTLERAIIKLNDHDKWTREQIADWLETLDIDLRFKPDHDILDV